MSAVFVTGTDTGIGKTWVSAWLTLGWRADYWKPVQTGLKDGTDFDAIARLVPGAIIHPSAYVFLPPLSPHQAAELDGGHIDDHALTLPPTDNTLVVEGAGGALVPLNGQTLTADVMARLGCPAVVVARPGLGTINHTLLTLEALRHRHVPILGVVVNGCDPADADHDRNIRAMEDFGQVRVLARLPLLPRLDGTALAALPPPAFAPHL